MAAASGCVATVEPPDRAPAPEVSFAPVDAELPLSLTRVTIQSSGQIDPGDLVLFEGEVSDARLSRLANGELPKTLEALRVPVLAWRTEPGDLALQPLRALTPGALYTLAGIRSGRLARFNVSSQLRPRLDRLWPIPADETPAGGQVVLCAAELPSAPELELEPGGIRAEVVRDFGWDGERPCALVRFDAASLEGRVLVLPPEVEGLALAPEPLAIGARPAALTFPICGADELELGPACARVEDDRLVLRNADQPLLYRFQSITHEGVPRIAAVAANGVFVVRGLPPASSVELRGTVTASDGAEAPFDLQVTTAPSRVRLVLNEVLANPRGAEPAGEWVELYNAGNASVNVGGMQLRDAGGVISLPEAVIARGAFALIVREDFVASASDVAPAPETPLIRVPVLAKNGLTNAGEPLALLNAAGEPLSEFPALAAPHAGVSVARRHPDALVSDTAAFAEHAEPGASPGAPNVLKAR